MLITDSKCGFMGVLYMFFNFCTLKIFKKYRKAFKYSGPSLSSFAFQDCTYPQSTTVWKYKRKSSRNKHVLKCTLLWVSWWNLPLPCSFPPQPWIIPLFSVFPVVTWQLSWLSYAVSQCLCSSFAFYLLTVTKCKKSYLEFGYAEEKPQSAAFKSKGESS